MENLTGIVTLPRGDTTLRLRLTMNGCAEIERELGHGFQVVLGRIAACAGRPGLDVTATRAIIWGAMLHADPETRPSDAGQLMDEIGLKRVDALVWDILEAAGFLSPAKGQPDDGQSDAGGEEGENPPAPPKTAAG